MSPAENRKRGRRSSSAAKRAETVPVFSLYGESRERPDDDFVHIEDIATRSGLYDWAIDRHVHHGLCQILLLVAGRVDLRLDEVAGERDGPCVVIVPPAAVHAFRFTPGAVGQVLTFAEGRLAGGAPERRALVEAVFARPAAINLANDEAALARLTRMLDDISHEIRQRDPAWTTMLECLVPGALVTVARLQASGLGGEAAGGRDGELYLRFRALVEKTFGEHRPIGWYADALGVSESRLDRAARAAAGQSAFETVQERLALEARRKLVYIAAPVTKIAYELGFEDPAYFWRFFRRRTGSTPAQFRRAARRRALAAP